MPSHSDTQRWAMGNAFCHDAKIVYQESMAILPPIIPTDSAITARRGVKEEKNASEIETFERRELS